MERHLWLFALLLIVVAPADVPAHGVDYEVDQGGVVISAWYEGMTPEPMADASVEVFGPGDDTTFQRGRTDRQGRFAFFPDRPGKWKVVINDGAGHALTAKVSVEETMVPEIRLRSRVSPWGKLVTGTSVIFGIFGLVSLVWRRGQARSGEV